MTQNPISWFEIYVQDMPRAKGFYEAVLQTRLEPLPNPPIAGLEMLKFPLSPDGYGAAGGLLVDTENDLIGLHSMD